MKKMILTLMLGIGGASLPAQEVWPLDRCIRYALEHNLDLREKQVEVDLKRADLTQSNLAYLPTIREIGRAHV